jgi:hypothetical protein
MTTKQKKERLSFSQKIEKSVPILESKNKDYKKVTHNKHVSYISIDKKTNIQKVMTAKQFSALKKIVKISEPISKLKDAFTRTNMNTDKGLKTGNKVYKKYKDENNKTRFAQFDKNSNTIEKTFSYKQAITLFKAFRREKSIKNLQTKLGITNKKDAVKEYNKRQEFVRQNIITNIMNRHNYNKDQAIGFYNSLKKRGRNDVLTGYYTHISK